MGLNVAFLKDSLLYKLANESDLTEFIEHGTLDPVSGQTNIGIFASNPETVKQVPSYIFNVFRTVPLLPSDPTTGYYVSGVTIFAKHHDQLKAGLMADNVQFLFTVPPPSSDRRWFYDITSGGIFNLDTLFIQRLPLGRQKSTDDGTDVYIDGIELRLIWADSSCDLTRCNFEDEECLANPLDTNFDPNCPC